MGIPRILVALLCALACISVTRVSGAQDETSPCGAVTAHRKDTVIVFDAPSTFTICRDGAVETDVVTGRPVYLEVLPTPSANMFEFRIHGRAAEVKPTGLDMWHEQSAQMALDLHQLAHSSAPISATPVPTEFASAPSLQPAVAARALYVGVVTPGFLDTLRGLRADLDELAVIVRVEVQWCDDLRRTAISASSRADLLARCGGVELQRGVIEHAVDAFSKSGRDFDGKNDVARDALIVAMAHPADSTVVSAAVQALDQARTTANSVISQALVLQPLAKAISKDALVLRAAIASINALRPGVPSYLATYDDPGNGALEIDAVPLHMQGAGVAIDQGEHSAASFRFAIIGRHYLDFEAGIGATGGLPQIPTLGMQAGANVIQGKPVDEFVGLALVELEPLRIPWPDRPLAGLVRFPVVGIPLSRDPTQNFFVGAGLGWTGVGSITVGPYLLRELSLRDGFAVGQSLPGGTSFDAATHPSLQVGYFACASIDLIGLFHLFVPTRLPTVDAGTGTELR
jgi:hypothetical protein